MKLIKCPRQNGFIITVEGNDRGVTETGSVTWQQLNNPKRTYLRRFRREYQLKLKALLGLNNKIRGERKA